MRTSAHSNIPRVYAFKFLVSLHFIGGVLVPFFTDWGGIRFFQVMILQSFFVLSVFLFEVPTGAVADYLGRKVSLLLAALLNTIAGFGLSRGVLLQNYMNKHIESSLRATVISTVSMIGTLVMGLLFPLAGLLVEWSLNGTLIIIGTAIILMYSSVKNARGVSAGLAHGK